MLSCTRDRETRELQYMPDMYVSPAVKPQEADPDNPGQSLMYEPPEGTIPREGIVPYKIAPGDTLSAGQLVNPLPISRDIFTLGEEYYNIFCSVCHGKTGSGDGPVVPKMTRPPMLYSEKAINWPDGRIYHIIAHGQGNMPSYKASVDPMTRWAIINYVRVLQKAWNPAGEDLEKQDNPDLTDTGKE